MAEKTEKATPKKLRDARKKGNVPRTTELSAALVMAAALIFFRFFGAGWLAELQAFMAWALTLPARGSLEPAALLEVGRATVRSTGMLLLMPVGLMALASVTGNLLQGPPPFTLQPMKPDASRLNPFKGLRKVFRTAGRTYIYAANGHGAWEAALANVLSRGDKVLILESGRFAASSQI